MIYLNILTLIGTMFVISCSNKSVDCKIDICIDAYGVCKHSLRTNEEITSELGEAGYVKLYLNDCKGTMELKGYNEDSIMLLNGYYFRSDEISEDSVLTIDPVSFEETITIEKSYRPTKTGSWKYYSENGKLIKEETYDRGKLISAKEY